MSDLDQTSHLENQILAAVERLVNEFGYDREDINNLLDDALEDA